jgi:hypothetical protein
MDSEAWPDIRGRQKKIPDRMIRSGIALFIRRNIKKTGYAAVLAVVS